MQQPMSMMSSVTEPMQQMVQAPMQAFQGIDQPAAKHDAVDGRHVSVGRGGECRRGRGRRRARAGRRRARVASAPPAPAVAGGVGGLPGAGLTSYTRPTSSFEPEAGGRPTGLRAGVLNAAEVRGPTAATGMGGSPMPMSPAGMLGHGKGARADDKDVDPRSRRRSEPIAPTPE